MKKTFLKNLFRDIKNTFSRFLSIVIIIAVGVSFYAGVRATSPDMKKSGDLYFKNNNLMDFKIVSTAGLTKDDLTEIRKTKGVELAEGSYSLDAIIEKDKHSLVMNINSLPNKEGINKINVVRGRRPENNMEAIIEERFFKENNLKLNDKIRLQSGNNSNIKNHLKNSEFKIVGTANSPLYISTQRELSSIGNGSVKGFVYILPEVFKSDVYTEIYVKNHGTEGENSLLNNDNYKEGIENIEKDLKTLGVKRSDIRYNNILKEGTDKINKAEEELNKAKEQLISNLSLMNKDKNKDKLDSQLRNNEVQLKNKEAELQKNKAQIDAQFKDREEEIKRNREKLKSLEKPKWYIMGRNLNVGYETYREDSNRIDNIGTVFPIMFFLVAALVSLTTMTRMVQEKRMEIGTFKALGYSRMAIVSHYLIYSLLASIIGSVIGISIGFRLFPPLIMKAYSTLYTIPTIVAPFNIYLALQSSIIVILLTGMSTVIATLEELKEVPASLMRPKSPKSGKVILLEKIPFIWKNLRFTRKVTARNIFRYKQRLFMTVIGIASCTALMITGFGIKGGVIGSTEKQFNYIYKYNMQANLSKEVDSTEKNNIKSKVASDSNIKSTLFAYLKNASLKIKNSAKEDVYVVVPEDKKDINTYINLTMKEEKLNLNDEGVIITEKLSKLMDKKVGEDFNLNINDKIVKVKISDITEHYVQHYVYMSPNYYKKLTGENLKFNSFYGLLKSVSDNSQEHTSKILTNIKGINSVVFKNNIQFDYDKSIDSINSVVLILIISAGVLAFVVIYNLTNININERKRELATIKLLGFYNHELAGYIYRENIILTIIGSLVGIVLGILLNNFVIITAETNILMFLRRVEPIYFLYSVMLTIGFSIIVNLAMYKKFDEIDMIESLKSME
ncbi:ABC transporter permease [Hathewaya massiliensis]|uniref:ABC transporter permease n=1 Tax=Hathewaya massiliensis TaxID=1964382 RepID=UPI001159381D|nr:ABC transporter permease [Hathewaya massiliensis]